MIEIGATSPIGNERESSSNPLRDSASSPTPCGPPAPIAFMSFAGHDIATSRPSARNRNSQGYFITRRLQACHSPGATCCCAPTFRPGIRLNELTCRPNMHISAGSRRDRATTARPGDQQHPQRDRADQRQVVEQHHREPEHHRHAENTIDLPAVWTVPTVAGAVIALGQLLAEAADHQQREVDAEAEADHRRRVHREDRGLHPQARRDTAARAT